MLFNEVCKCKEQRVFFTEIYTIRFHYVLSVIIVEALIKRSVEQCHNDVEIP